MLTNTKSGNLLALAPGKREFGVAVFNGIDLTYYSLKVLRKGSSDRIVARQTGKLMEDLIETFDPRIIAMKSISQYQRTSLALQIISRVVRREAQTYSLPLFEISLAEVSSLVTGPATVTKRKVSAYLAEIYPELLQFMNRPSKSQTEYYNNLFMAVSVGLVCLRAGSENRENGL
jgi:hypothetical protein